EFVHLDVAAAQLGAVAVAEATDFAVDFLDGAAPQFAGVHVPHDLGVVVVAVQAQRLTEHGIVDLVPGGALAGHPVRAGPAEGLAAFRSAGAAVFAAAVGGVDVHDAVVNKAEG